MGFQQKLLEKAYFTAWENSRHFAMPPLVSPQNDVWGTSVQLPYWWRVTTQIWVVEANFPHGTTNQKHNPDLGADASKVRNFSDVISRGNQWWHHKMTADFSGYLRVWMVSSDFWKAPKNNTEFHMTSRRPYKCHVLKQWNDGHVGVSKKILWELNSFFFFKKTLPFVPINLHRCGLRKWKRS